MGNYPYVLEAAAHLLRYKRRDEVRHPYNLGLFFESTTKPSFTPVVEGDDFVRWVLANNRDPVKDFPFPLKNLYTWAGAQVLKEGIFVARAELLSPDERKCVPYGVPYVIFGSDDAKKHLLSSKEKAQGTRFVKEASHIGDLIKPVRKTFGF